MKRIIGILIFIICTTSIYCQQSHYKYKPVTYNPNSGYVTINELNYGFDLGVSSVTLSDSSSAFGDSTIYGTQILYGITSIHGYQLNIVNMNFKSSVQAGIGSGVLLYDGVPRIPLYLDIRYILDLHSISPFVYNDCGLIINFKEFDQTKLFLNPGAGVKLKISRSFAATVGAGLFVQMGNFVFKESFLNFKAGIIYKLKQ
jgi:hypothetical protein